MKRNRKSTSEWRIKGRLTGREGAKSEERQWKVTGGGSGDGDGKRGRLSESDCTVRGGGVSSSGGDEEKAKLEQQ